jgi:dipeptidyl aminopeptidase/acylaminoacyl peptidase
MMRLTHVVLAAVCSIAAQAAEAPPPVEAYGRLPAISDAALSPDGKRLAMTVGYEFQQADPTREPAVFRILNIDTGAFEHTMAPPAGNKLRGAGWADERRPYYIVSRALNPKDAAPSSWPVMFRGDRAEFARMGLVSLDTGKVTQPMQAAEFRFNGSLANLQAPIEGDPGFGRMIAVGGASGMGATPRISVYRVNLDDGTSSSVYSGNVQTRGYLLDEKGNVAARVDINDFNNRWKLFTYEDGKDRMILEQESEMGMPLRMFGLLEDGRIAAVNQHEDGERNTLLGIDRKTGEARPLHSTKGSDVGTINDPWKHRIVGVQWIDDFPKQEFFDPQLKMLADAVAPSFAGGFGVLVSWSRDRGRALVFGERPGDPGAWYIYDQTTKKLRSVGKLYPALTKPEHLGIRSAIKYKARDGQQIPAYLTLPAGVEPKKLPLVLLVHGGPHARDTQMFDWWAAFLASRGYAVLQPNYRGSTGYGYEWFDAGRGGWGDGVMQTDVEDGVDALVKGGYVDASRVCIMGGSYGGYAALAGATITPERYACAVSVNGVSAPERLLNHALRDRAGSRGMTAEWWNKSMGPVDHLRKVTPADLADKVRAPVLILHGLNDAVVPIEQSELMVRRLKGADKKVKFVELQGDDHWLSLAQTRTQMLSEVEKFLAENLAAKP